jgi:hypothetical protein
MGPKKIIRNAQVEGASLSDSNDGGFAAHGRPDFQGGLPQEQVVASFDEVGVIFGVAAREVPVDWLISMHAVQGGRTVIERSFANALEIVEATPGGVGTFGYEDRVIADELRSIVNGTDPRGGTFFDQAIRVGAKLSRRVIERGDYRPEDKVEDRDNSLLKENDVIVGDNGARLQILAATPRGAYVELETAFGPMYVDADGSQRVIPTKTP